MAIVSLSFLLHLTELEAKLYLWFVHSYLFLYNQMESGLSNINTVILNVTL